MSNLLRRLAVTGILGIAFFSAGGQTSSALFTGSDASSAGATTGHWAAPVSAPQPVAPPAATTDPVLVIPSAPPIFVTSDPVATPAPTAPEPAPAQEPVPDAAPAPSAPVAPVPTQEPTQPTAPVTPQPEAVTPSPAPAPEATEAPTTP